MRSTGVVEEGLDLRYSAGEVEQRELQRIVRMVETMGNA